MERKRYEIGSLAQGLDERAISLAQYMIEHKATVRQTASVFGVSKSTVHKDLTEKLPFINHALAAGVREVLDINKSERHIRGGMATKDKYMREKSSQPTPYSS
jgi:putative DeoR family transcriptional regulator (stage III sporulation protein D)